jgi:protein-tyrosine kinase
MGLIEEAMAKRGRRGASTSPRPPRSHVPVRGEIDLESVRRVEPAAGAAKKNRLICESMDPAAVGAYKMLRTQVSLRLRANSWTSIGVTAARPGEGKTLTAINLALSLAMNPDQHVFLVDFDLRRHCVTQYMGVSGASSLRDVLNGAPLTEALVRYRDERVYGLLNEESFENSSEILASEEAAQLARQIKGLGGISIYDLPPLLSADDYLAFSHHVDCTLFVVSEGETQRADVIRAREMIDEEKLLGIVLNKSRARDLADTYYY